MVADCPSEEALLLYLAGGGGGGETGGGGEHDLIRAHVMTCGPCRELVALEARMEPLFAGKYALERELGAGGMGRVVLARHVKLGKPVAIKMLHAAYRREPKVVERFSREARAAAMLKSRHVVQVLDIDTANGEPFIVMEYLAGMDLASKLAHEGPLTVDDAVRFVAEACHALAEAHGAGIVHRDVKPANLFLTDEGVVKVLDFGLAKALPNSTFLQGDLSSLTRPADLLGSPRFMSPEQFGGEVDHRTDIWSIGVTLYTLLCGEPPFLATDLAELREKIMSGDAIPLATRRPDVPRSIGLAIERCLAVSRDARWSSIEDFVRALTSAPSDERPLGRTLPFDVGRYTVLRRIAAGGMGTVYLGRARGAQGFSRAVALKQLHPHLSASEDTRRRFLAEARIVSHIDHPHVVKVLDVVEDGSQVFLVLDYVHGETLHHLLRVAGTLSLSVVASIFCQIAEALHAAHEAGDEVGAPLGVVHRDVSPHNVLVAKQGAAYVTDFGVAKVKAHLGETLSGIIGKTGYMAPEQMRGETVTRAADLYALGVMLWETLTRQRLFPGAEGRAARENAIVAPSRIDRAIPRALDGLVLSMLAPAPAGRPATALAVARQLRQIVTPATEEEVGAWVASLAQGKLAGLEIALAAEWGPTTPAGPASRTVVDTTPSLLRSRAPRRHAARAVGATAVIAVGILVARMLRPAPVVAAPSVVVPSATPVTPVTSVTLTIDAVTPPPVVTTAGASTSPRHRAPSPIARAAPSDSTPIAGAPPTASTAMKPDLFPSTRK